MKVRLEDHLDRITKLAPVGSGEHLRIEIGISLRPVLEELSAAIKAYYLGESYQVVESTSAWKNWFRSADGQTAESFLLHSSMSQEDQTWFWEHVTEIQRGQLISELNAQQTSLLKIAVLCVTANKVVVETGSFYASILQQTYIVLQRFVQRGGVLVEIAYPHFAPEDPLRSLVTDRLRMIQLGEMVVTG